MKKFLVAAALLVPIAGLAQVSTYRCGEKYQDIPKGGKAKGCKIFKSPSPNWTYVVGAPEVLIFMDKSTVKPQEKYLKAWVLSSYPDDIRLPDKKRARSEQDLVYFDCLAGTRGVKQSIYYSDENGETPTGFRPQVIEDVLINFFEPPPGSVGQILNAFVCAMASVANKSE